MIRYIFPLVALSLIACSQKDDETGAETGIGTIGTETGLTDTSTDTDPGTTTDTGTEVECNATVTAITPADGATNVPQNLLIIADFSEAVDEATMTVTGPDGPVAGAAHVVIDGMSISFSLESELARETQYDVEVTVCDMTTTSSFTTLEPAIEVNALIGRVYDLDLTSVSWTAPPANIAGLMMGFITTSHMLLLVEDVDESAQTMELAGAAGWENNSVVTQYPCAEAIDFDPSDFSSNPFFSAGPATTVMEVGSERVSLEELVFEGSFVNQGDSIDNLHLTTYLDGEIELDGFGRLCDAVALFGVSCEPCPSDSSLDCLLLDATASNVVAKPNLMIDVDIDPSQNTACN